MKHNMPLHIKKLVVHPQRRDLSFGLAHYEPGNDRDVALDLRTVDLDREERPEQEQNSAESSATKRISGVHGPGPEGASDLTHLWEAACRPLPKCISRTSRVGVDRN